MVDSGPLIKNDPTVSTLLAKSHELYTIPAVLTEIRDPETRARVDTTLVPFLKLRNPKADSIKFVTEFARKTGDLEVLSKPDIHLVALAYELQCERDGSDWRLNKEPNHRNHGTSSRRNSTSKGDTLDAVPSTNGSSASTDSASNVSSSEDMPRLVDTISRDVNNLSLQPITLPTLEEESEPSESETESDDDDSDGWITPANVHKHIEADKKAAAERDAQEVEIVENLEAALLTSDYAMQNVALRVGLSVLSPAMCRITELKSWVLRCHGCFNITRDMSKQFCPRCGQPTLLRAACSTDENGKFNIHLKRNFQWNARGNVYSIPKPVHGTANGKNRGQGGGKNGWGQNLILAEDQKEYQRALDQKRRERKKDLMDEDILPGIVSGDRNSGGGKVKVGAGRNVNARKRR